MNARSILAALVWTACSESPPPADGGPPAPDAGPILEDAGTDAGADPIFAARYGSPGDRLQMRLIETRGPDGTSHLHGESRLDLAIGDDPYLVEQTDDAELDADGFIVTADSRMRIRLGEKTIERRIQLDRPNDTIIVTRPNGTVTWHPQASEVPWVPGSIAAIDLGPWAPSPVHCEALERTFVRADEFLFVDPTWMSIGGVAGDPGAAHPASLNWIYVCEYDGDGHLAGVDYANEYVPAYWRIAEVNRPARREDDGTPLVELPPAETAGPAIEPEICEASARTEAFSVSVGEGLEVHGQVDLPSSATFGEGPYPFVLISNGGAGWDRSGSWFVATQNTCLAQRLNAAGIAAVRWDNLGFGESTPVDTYTRSFESFLEELTAVARYVSERSDVREDGFFLFGHSASTMSSIEAANEISAVDGLILGGGSYEGYEYAVHQATGQYRAAGFSEEEMSARVAAATAYWAGVADGSIDRGTTYFRDVFEYPAIERALSAARPTLLLHGRADSYVAASGSEDLRDALAEAGVEVEAQFFDGLGHFMVPSAPGLEGLGEEGGYPLAWDDEVETVITEWVLRHVDAR